MISLKFDAQSKNDLTLDKNGDLALCSDKEAVMQLCEAAAETLLGECEFNQQEGLPYRELIFIAAPNIKLFGSLLIKRILLIDGVISARILNTSISKNIFNYEIMIETIYGSSSLNGEVYQ